jgi:mRNA-degrading endonuclease toxin of MazEF toxin-antitoxin module
MKRLVLALVCPLLLSACSAEVAVETPPQTQNIPVTSVLEPAFVEVAVDLPPETQGLDVTVKEISATLTVHNPSQAFTLKTVGRLSLEGNATPDSPIFYSQNNLPPYYATAEILLPEREFAPGSHTPVSINSPTLVKAIGQKRLWIIVSNTVTKATLGGTLPLEIQLENIILRATVTKSFHGLDGALGVGGL